MLDEGFLPVRFARTVVVLHPGAEPTGQSDVPFAAPNPNNEVLTEAEQQAFDTAMLELLPASTPCKFALYGGFSSFREGKELERLGMKRIEGRLNFFVGEGELSKHLFRATDEAFGGFLPLSYLWAEDGSWFLASPPDLDFTAVGCGDEIAERLLSDLTPNSLDWPELQVAHAPQ